MKPSPGASPTEDGLIEKALRVMGATPTNVKEINYLSRVGQWVSNMNESHKALFIHECRLYLREKGAEHIETRYYTDGAGVLLYPRILPDPYRQPLFIEATEELAYAQAVIAASGQEIGQAETQAPSTTSHQTENDTKEVTKDAK